MRRRGKQLRRTCSDRKEGFEFQGRWITPEEAHRECKSMMDRIDALPKEKRLYIYEHNELPREKK